MGQHTNPDRSAFWRSVGESAARALVVIGLAAVAVTLAVGFLGDDEPASDELVLRDDDAARPDVAEASAAAAEDAPLPPDPGRASPDPSAPVETDDAPAATTPEPEAETEPEPAPAEGAATDLAASAPPPAETTVQVLDGVGGDGQQAQAAAQVLRDLGYDVIVVNPAGRDYGTTEVQFSAGHDAAAEALTAKDPRFATTRPAQDLSDTVDLHVVVGSDFSG